MATVAGGLLLAPAAGWALAGLALAVLLITAYPSIDTAVRGMKLGARDYIGKPFSPDELRLVVQRALAEDLAEGRCHDGAELQEVDPVPETAELDREIADVSLQGGLRRGGVPEGEVERSRRRRRRRRRSDGG